MPEIRYTAIPELVVADRRLGRHIHHDDRSRAFVAEQATTLKTTTHKRHVGPFDQGQLGSCTFNALAGALMTDPLTRAGRVLDEQLAVLGYSLATRIDSTPGNWPPNDTGSSGLAVCKAAQQSGLIKSYGHTFSLQAALGALVLNPVIIGINWYDSFDDGGDGNGILSISADAVVRGGHEVELNFIDVERKLVGGYNSWGTTWGQLHGQFLMAWTTFDRLLAEQGDVTAPKMT